MPDLATMSLLGIVVLAVLVVVYLKLRQKDLISAAMQKRAASSKLCSRAEYVEGMEKIPVALSLTADTIYYENPDLEASFDLSRIDEVEYSDELATGRTVEASQRVLRLRAHGAAFEFLLDDAEAKKWMAALPPRMMDQSPTAARAV
jgi:hypothetical protein